MKCQLKGLLTLKDRDYTVVNMSGGGNLAGHSRVLSPCRERHVRAESKKSKVETPRSLRVEREGSPRRQVEEVTKRR